MIVTNIGRALFILRASMVIFLTPWVIEKFTHPEITAKIFAHFYKIPNLPLWGSYLVGFGWAILLLAFAIGYKKKISYGLVMLFHGVSTLASIPNMIPGLDGYNHLFLAGIPVLGGLIALYMLRDYDTILTVS